MGAAGKDSGCNSMRVGLIDVDGHNFPNIPLMKLSAWHKQQGDTVEWYEPLFSGHMNRVYMSKVFSFTQDYPYFVDADEVVRGGSGYCIELADGREHYQKERDKELPPEVEHIYPDYSIYPELTQDKAFGFLTRGCPRGCEFCHVGCKEGKRSHKVADLSEFWRGQKNIVLCDPNTLACPEHMELLQQLKDSKARVNFNQGLDIRLMNERNIELLKQIKLETIHVAYDRYTDKDIIEAKMKMFKEMTGYNKDRGRVMVYVLCNFDTTIEQDIERIPANGYLMQTDMKLLLKQEANQVTRLRDALEEISEAYDYCICDCGRLLDMVVINILLAAELVIAPVKVGGYENEAIHNLQEQVDDLREINPELRIKGLVTMRQKNKTSLDFEEWMKTSSGFDMFVTPIRRSIVAEKASMRMAVLPQFSKNCIVSQDYRNVVHELLKELEG